MIGLSPLSAGHRRRFQPTCVRPSTGSYPRFSLPTDSSPGFASAARDSSRPVKARFRSGSLSVNLAPRQRLAGSFYKRHAVTPYRCSDCSWAHGFRYCFTPLPGCFSPFPLGTMRYRSLTVFSLGPWAARIQTEFLVLRSTWDWVFRGTGFSSTRLSRSAARFSNTIRLTRSFLTLRKLSSASPTVPQLPIQQRLLPCTVWV